MMPNTLGHWRGEGRFKRHFLILTLTLCAILFCACCSLFTGCESVNNSEDPALISARRRDEARAAANQEASRLRPFSVMVESEPPGAIIEVNEDMRGRAPCQITIEGRADRTTSPLGRLTTIKAIPAHPGESVQLKFIMSGDRIPARLYFNMNLRAPIPQIDVNVNE